MGERVPQHVQNLVLRDYCQKKGYEYLLSATEYAMDDSFLVLQQALSEIPKITGIVAYSLFQMPESSQYRLDLLDRVIDLGGEMHFAVEGLKVTTKEELSKIEDIWLVRRALPKCYGPKAREVKGKLKNIVTPLHNSTKREYLARMIDDKVRCMTIAKKYGHEYWDGDRRYGYGGYKYYPGRWKSVAEQMICSYNLKPGSKVLDIGCGKGYLLHELKQLIPDLRIYGLDISTYAISNAKEEVKSFLFEHKAEKKLPFNDNDFDLVFSLGVFHNLKLFELKNALSEMDRVGKQGYLMVESYRNVLELFNLQCWALTAETFLDCEEWVYLYNEAGYKGDYEFIYFQ